MASARGALAATWWGHSSVTVELDGVRVATDPLLSGRLFHLRRTGPAPPPEATRADVVVVSHLHHDHLHVPSLLRFDAAVPVVAPVGAVDAVPALRRRSVLEVAPGERVEVAGVTIEALTARHDGRRHTLSRRRAPALGFRLDRAGSSCWYSGDTGVHDDVEALAPVDLALVAIGGWGPTLGEGHLSPAQAASMVHRLGARWALAVHYGTFWPLAMRRLHPANHRRLFLGPPGSFVEAMAQQGVAATPLVPAFGERLELDRPGP